MLLSKHSLAWDLVWSRLKRSVLSSEERDVMLTVIHDIYPFKDRLFRMNQHPTGFCSCCRGVIESSLHLFKDCSRSRPSWVYIKTLVSSMFPLNMLRNLDILYLVHLKTSRENIPGLIFCPLRTLLL